MFATRERTVSMDDVMLGAEFSPCGSYRYILRRELEGGEGICVFGMLNPSKADAFRNDPTVLRNIGFAKLWGYHWMFVVNLFAYRATDPKDMKRAKDPIGLENDRYIKEALVSSDIFIAAWGNNGSYMHRSGDVKELLRQTCPAKVFHLGLTKTGQPGHPLFLLESTKRVRMFC